MPTVDLVITFPSVPVATECAEAFAAVYHYPVSVYNDASPPVLVPNPQSKKDFMKSHIVAYIKSIARSGRTALAAETENVKADVDVTLTG